MISIIVPVYHVEKELRRCLDSILCQTFTDLELILVNDGGNEAETSICEEYAEKDSRIVYRYQSNNGPGAARNTGLDIARGEYPLQPGQMQIRSLTNGFIYSERKDMNISKNTILKCLTPKKTYSHSAL